MKRSGHLSAPDAVSMLMRRIEAGRFRPGERIMPKDIAKDMGSSPIPVREALCRLVGRGIVVDQRNKGFSLAPMTSTTLCNLYAAHGRLMENALAGSEKGLSLPGRLHDPWRAFAAIACHIDSEVLAGMQYHLAGRLAVARRFEKAWFTDNGIEHAVIGAGRQIDAATILTASRKFHQDCERAAAEIWRLLTDR